MMLRKIIGWLTPRKKCTFKHFDIVNGSEFTCDDIRAHKIACMSQFMSKNRNGITIEKDNKFKKHLKLYDDALANCTCSKDE